jgi:hypothetical protein
MQFTCVERITGIRMEEFTGQLPAFIRGSSGAVAIWRKKWLLEQHSVRCLMPNGIAFNLLDITIRFRWKSSKRTQQEVCTDSTGGVILH